MQQICSCCVDGLSIDSIADVFCGRLPCVGACFVFCVPLHVQVLEEQARGLRKLTDTLKTDLRHLRHMLRKEQADSQQVRQQPRPASPRCP